MKACNGTYYVTVIEDTFAKKVVGTALLIYKREFIRNYSTVREIMLS